jgi:hypothetical protein
MTTVSWVLLGAGALALVLGAAIPGRAGATLSKRAAKRRIYWTGTVVGVILLFASGLPDVQSAVATAAAAVVLMVGSAYFRTPHLKIGGQIYSAYEPHRAPDPPPGV